MVLKITSDVAFSSSWDWACAINKIEMAVGAADCRTKASLIMFGTRRSKHILNIKEGRPINLTNKLFLIEFT